MYSLRVAQQCLAAMLWALSGAVCIAQPTQLYFHHLTTRDGFSEAYNDYIFKDRKGYVWFGSSAGIGRHNGEKVEMLRPKGLIGHSVSSPFLEDTLRRRMWFSTTKALNCYRQSENDFVSFAPPVVPVKNCRLIYQEMSSGRLWAIVNDTLLWSLDADAPAQNQVRTMGALATGSSFWPLTDATTGMLTGILVTNEAQPKQGIQVFGLAGGQIRLERTMLRGAQAPKIAKVVPDPAGRIWVCTYQGLMLYDLQNEKTVFEDRKIGKTLDLLRYGPAHLLLATEQGICLYNAQTRQVERRFTNNPQDPNSLGDDETSRLYLDYDQTLWVTTWSGVDYANLDKIKFEKIPNADFGGNFLPKSIARSAGGSLLFANDFDKGLRLREASGNMRRLPVPLNTSLIYPLSESEFLLSVDPNSDQYESGSSWYDQASGKLTPIHLADGRTCPMNAFCCLHDGRILAGGEGGLFLLRKEKMKVNAALAPGIAMTNVTFLAQDSSGRVFAGNNDESIAVFQSGNGSLLLAQNIAVNGHANTFAETQQYLWFGGEFGLLRVDKTNLNATRLFHTSDGLPNNKVYGVLADKRGDLWLSTNRGLAYFQVADSSFHAFGLADGLQGLEFNTHSYCAASEGYFWFGGMGGFNRFHPDSILQKRLKQTPALVLNNLIINYKPYREVLKNAPANPNEITRLNLAHDENNLQFDFSALEYSDPENQLILYQLTSADELPNENKWVQISGAHTVIRFDELLPGRYKLYLQATNSDGIRCKSPFIMDLLISLPIYQQPWFLILLTLIALFAGFLYNRHYFRQQLRWQKLLLIEKDFEIQKLLAIDAEKKRIADEMHDDLGSVLTTIIKKLEKLFDDPRFAAISAPMKEIAGKADTAIKNMRHIIWALESKDDTLAATFAYIVENAAEYLQGHEIAFEVKPQPDLPRVTLTGGQRRSLFLAVQEALHNVVKHASAQNVSMIYENVGAAIRISIRDNGIGLGQSTRIGKGTDTLRKNMEALRGTADVRPAFPGTEVLLQFPIQHLPPST